MFADMFSTSVVETGSLGADPNRPLDEAATLEDHLLKHMCSSNTLLKKLTAELIFAICEEDVQKFVGLTGMGNAAGFLHERDLLSSLAGVVHGGPI